MTSAILNSRANSICRFAQVVQADRAKKPVDWICRRRHRDQFADHRRPSDARKQKRKSPLAGGTRSRAKRAINYKLRDWLFSRQRYWGEPFPIVWEDRKTSQALNENELPVVPPPLEDYKPTAPANRHWQKRKIGFVIPTERRAKRTRCRNGQAHVGIT